MIKVAPSILSADFAKLGEEVISITKAGADMIHIDVMDGNFVPNITIGPAVISSIRKHSSLPFDVHLMVSSPEHLFEDFVKSGADIITIHPEAVKHLDRAISQIKALGARAGISLLPSTPTNVLDYMLDKIDLILVMTVNPGFGGQKFMTNQLSKISEIAEKIRISGRQDIILAVDGGINNITAKECIDKGADMLIAGSYIFNHASYQDAISTLKRSFS